MRLRFQVGNPFLWICSKLPNNVGVTQLAPSYTPSDITYFFLYCEKGVYRLGGVSFKSCEVTLALSLNYLTNKRPLKF